MSTIRPGGKNLTRLAMAPKAVAILLAIASAGLSGCGAVPQSKYYQLSVPGEVGPATTDEPLPITLIVGPLKASHLYREDRLVYATDTDEMGTYQVHRWAEPPTELIQELLWRTLRESHRYNAVSLLTSSAHGDFLLRGNLYDFKELDRGPLAARVNIELELRETATGAIVWTHSYSHDEPVKGKDVAAVVGALDQNAQRFVREAEASLNEYLSANDKR